MWRSWQNVLNKLSFRFLLGFVVIGMIACSEQSSNESLGQENDLGLGDFGEGDTVVELPLQLTVELNLLRVPGDSDSSDVALSLPVAAKNVFASYNCFACHSSVAVSGGLDLEAFPFVRSGVTLSSREAMAEFLPVLIGRMQSTSAPMPPFGPQPSAEELSVFTDWAKELEVDDSVEAPEFRLEWGLILPSGEAFQAELVSTGANSYELGDQLVLEAGKTYQYSLRIVDQNEVVWYEDAALEFVMPLNGNVDLHFDLSYE